MKKSLNLSNLCTRKFFCHEEWPSQKATNCAVLKIQNRYSKSQFVFLSNLKETLYIRSNRKLPKQCYFDCGEKQVNFVAFR